MGDIKLKHGDWNGAGAHTNYRRSLAALSEDNQPLITPLTILDTKWESTTSEKQLLVLVQWSRLFLEDTSWEKWENPREDYNLKDKVVLEARGDVMNEKQNTKQYVPTKHYVELNER
ncbi:hypothetical protein HKD37_01G001496 [Glycine soja]